MATTIAANNDAPASQTFTLHIISPSLGSHGPFSFPNLPIATTVQQLKAKIRERVQTKPHDDHQRLIHRGRQLTEVETMADIFGKETLSNEDSQSLHLVLRPPAQDPPPYMPTPQPRTTQQNSQTQPQAVPFQTETPPSSSQLPQQTFPTMHAPVPVGPTETGAHQPAPTSAPTVYILSTPSGPRALLLSNPSSYYTSSPTATTALPHAHAAHTPHQPGQQPIYQPQHFQPQHYQPQHFQPQPRPHPQARRQAQLQAQHHGAQPEPVLMGHQGNPAAAGALAAQLAPHIWLVVRLIGFVWFFTSGNTSWWRWCMITGLSVVFFFINTGLIDWAPIRRHLENLIPLAMPAVNPEGAAAGGAAAAGAGAGTEGRAGELDPQRVAQRLIEQRQRQNAGWFMSQVRRVEHATLLFLASLWPGVGERHVAAREEEDNARRRREEAAEAERVAAETAAQEAAQAAAGEGAEKEDGGGDVGESDKATGEGLSTAEEILVAQGEASGEGIGARELPETQAEGSGDGGVAGPQSRLARDW
ncbi:hypothetical protein V499_01517 [Pseudogymnoascus sp. VKM F-103]|uniref:Ubiquitin-like domain-containing protein n=1 Tax=Pseudogymnoascus verrucosus TaxID=342668 RepID=A0A1B8GY90_9PEZI|nr:uncharacterized protein VE01_01132 [Pseudogymnoascus verrucosus]KFY79505.1 hypothetical protein V499_01517 [Pseudogymnoascus sp. VKM F-103]OBU00800.1 hypothetical protein VE01_01132 [Pseudogymnoascus verrucosus]